MVAGELGIQGRWRAALRNSLGSITGVRRASWRPFPLKSPTPGAARSPKCGSWLGQEPYDPTCPANSNKLQSELLASLQFKMPVEFDWYGTLQGYRQCPSEPLVYLSRSPHQPPSTSFALTKRLPSPLALQQTIIWI